MRSMLITGGAGFIGGNFVHWWMRRHPGDRLVILDALTYAGNVATIATALAKPGVTFVHGDITDADTVSRVMAEHDIDTVVHFAAESHVDRSIVSAGEFVRTNVLGTQVLLDAVRDAWRSNNHWRPRVRFHHVSTDEVYGSLAPSDPAFHEGTPYAPSSPYAASKAGSDHLVRACAHTFGLPVSISNCSNNYGPYQFPEKLIPLMIVNALHGKPLPVYGDGRQVRDWLYVDDHCAAIARILEADVAGETFNVGGEAEHENIRLVARLCELLDARFMADATLAQHFPHCPASSPSASCRDLITHVRDRAGHDRRYAINPQKIQRTLNFNPTQTMESGLALTVDWYLQNPSWWNAVLDGSYRHPPSNRQP